MARLYVPQFHKLQHVILQEAWDKPEMQGGQLIGPTINQLVDLTRASEPQVLRAVQYLKERGFVHNDPKANVVCSPIGEVALHKEDLLEEGWEKFKANLLRWTQIGCLLVGAIIAVANFTDFGKRKEQQKEVPMLLPAKEQNHKQRQVSVPRYRARQAAVPSSRDSVKRK